MEEEILSERGATPARAAEASNVMETGPLSGIVGNTVSLEKADEGNVADKKLMVQILHLKKVQAEMKKAKKEADQKVRNLQRQIKRLSVESRLLSDDDLGRVRRSAGRRHSKGVSRRRRPRRMRGQGRTSEHVATELAGMLLQEQTMQPTHSGCVAC